MRYSTGDDPHTITPTHDEVLILFEFFERLEERNGLSFEHPAESIALGHLTAQLEAIPWEVFDKDYPKLLVGARWRRSQGFEGEVKGLGYVKVTDDGQVVPVAPQDRG
ncbi:MAG: hypothetical protein ACYC0C_16570 [Devosia sp.]